MTRPTRPHLARLTWLWRWAAGLALVLASSSPAVAGDPPPWLPQVSDKPMQVVIPAAPANVQAVLVERMAVDGSSPARYSSQDFVANQDDSQGADDFCIPGTAASWVITNVDVVGAYNNLAYSVSTVKVFFYARGNGTLPGAALFSATVTGPHLANAGSGSFGLTLDPPAQLAGNNCYWVSVQAVQPGGYNAGETWQWTERTAATADAFPSAYRLPGKPGHPCQTWGARLTTCFPTAASNQDFTLRLSGSVADTNLTPQILTMNPAGALNTAVQLRLTGLNFAAGAQLSWTAGISPTQVYTTTVVDGGYLTAVIPAAYVGPQGATASVLITNPGPCVGSCVSNTVIFEFEDIRTLYLPLIHR